MLLWSDLHLVYFHNLILHIVFKTPSGVTYEQSFLFFLVVSGEEVIIILLIIC